MTPFGDDVFTRLSNCVENRIGLCSRAGDSESFRKTLLGRMKKVNISAPEEYLDLLEAGTRASQQEWQALAILLTTGESYFFRDKGHFALLQHSILPELLKSKQDQRSLRIWSAGCAAGEEPYSVAILLDMLLPDRQGWDILILGTDINEESLQKAEQGLYSPWSFRLMDKTIQREYFTSRKGAWQLAEKIKKMVRFKSCNLLEASFFTQNPEISNMDIIICRNVFIYFNITSISAVVHNFTEILRDAGYLITGHGELQGQDLTNLQQILSQEAVIYQKVVGLKRKFPEVARVSERIKQRPRLAAKGKIVPKSLLPPQPSRKSPLRDPMADIEELIKKGRYGEAIARVKNCLPASVDRHDMICLLANAYANSGNYGKAVSACREATGIKADSAEPYFLLAQIAEAQGNDEEAKSLLRKTLYLNPAFVAAYCELGGLYERENDLPRAGKLRATAIDLLRALPATARVRPYDLAAGELLNYLEGLSRSSELP